MIPDWLRVLGRLWPVLIISSVGIIAFGVYRFLGLMGTRHETKAEEEAKRQEFIKNMNSKLKMRSKH
jgi:hypothetical protein